MDRREINQLLACLCSSPLLTVVTLIIKKNKTEVLSLCTYNTRTTVMMKKFHPQVKIPTLYIISIFGNDRTKLVSNDFTNCELSPIIRASW